MEAQDWLTLFTFAGQSTLSARHLQSKAHGPPNSLGLMGNLQNWHSSRDYGAKKQSFSVKFKVKSI
jgi:hypothetical protein